MHSHSQSVPSVAEFREFEAASVAVAEAVFDLSTVWRSRSIPDGVPIQEHHRNRCFSIFMGIWRATTKNPGVIERWEPLIASFGSAMDSAEFRQSADPSIRSVLSWPTWHGLASMCLLISIRRHSPVPVDADEEDLAESRDEIVDFLLQHWSITEPIQLQQINARMIRERAQAANFCGVNLLGATGFSGSKPPEEPIPFTRQQVADYTDLEVSSLTDRAKEWGPVITKAAKGRPEVRDYREARESLKAQFPHKQWPETPPW